jgi:EmrB/QacA subfamily drug resistance transporter
MSEYPLHTKIAPFVIATSLFIETLDSTIINSAIPVIASNFNRPAVDLKVALTSYLISLAIFIPISGWLADKFGSKKILTIGISVFGLGSFLCGLSTSLEELVITRTIQGIGGALMMPVCRLILLKTYPKSQLVIITNYATIPSLIGPALGPILGGIIVTYYHWSWVFFVNVPLCILLLLLVTFGMKDFQEEATPALDFKGFLLFTSGLGLLTFTIECMSEEYISYSTSFTLLGIGLLLISLYQHRSHDISNPIVDTKLFKISTLKITVICSILSRTAVGGVPFLIPLLLQIHHAFSPIASGFLTMPCIIGMVVTKVFVTKILRRFGFRNTTIINTTLLGAILLFMIILVKTQNYFVIATTMFIFGMVLSMQFSCLNTLAYEI